MTAKIEENDARISQVDQFAAVTARPKLGGVEEEEGEDCITILLNYLTMLGFQDVSAEVENAHRTGKRNENGRPRHIIAKLYSRPFKRKLLQIAKTPDKKAMLNGVRFVEDLRIMISKYVRKHFPLCRKPSKKEKKSSLKKGKLYVEGNVVPLSLKLNFK